MGRSELLPAAQVRDVFRLIGDCRDLGSDPALWCPRMLEGLRALVGAATAAGGEGLAPTPERPPTALSSFESGMDPLKRSLFEAYVQAKGASLDTFYRQFPYTPGGAVTHSWRQVIPSNEYLGAVVYQKYLRPAGIEHRLASFYWPSPDKPLSALHLDRPADDRDFSARERQLIHFFHQELGPLVGRALVSVAEPSPDDLPSRLRQTLACLLEGDSEKQVAARLGLSTATIHQYVTALFRRFGVRSRAQLMAYALKRPRLGATRKGTGHAGPGRGDMYIVRRNAAFGWGEPRNLGCIENGTGPDSEGAEFSPSLVTTAQGTFLYFSSTVTGNHDIYQSQVRSDGVRAAHPGRRSQHGVR